MMLKPDCLLLKRQSIFMAKKHPGEKGETPG